MEIIRTLGHQIGSQLGIHHLVIKSYCQSAEEYCCSSETQQHKLLKAIVNPLFFAGPVPLICRVTLLFNLGNSREGRLWESWVQLPALLERAQSPHPWRVAGTGMASFWTHHAFH